MYPSMDVVREAFEVVEQIENLTHEAENLENLIAAARVENAPMEIFVLGWCHRSSHGTACHTAILEVLQKQVEDYRAAISELKKKFE